MKTSSKDLQINFRIPSPVQQVYDELFTKKRIHVFVKRDDLIHPFIGGNKWRKLKYTVEYARELGVKELITFGGAYSNHLLATACAGALCGLNTVAYVRGEEHVPPNQVLYLCACFGMTLCYVKRETYSLLTSANRALSTQLNLPWGENYVGEAGSYLVIPEGGAGAPALEGCAELATEIGKGFDHVVLASGTGTTAAGLANGFARQSFDTRVEAIVVLKSGGPLKEQVTARLEPGATVRFHTEYHFGGYARTTPHLLQFIREFNSATGIMLEPCYTGKAFYALTDLASKDLFLPGSKILFVHTGGLTGALGFNNQVNA